MRTKLMCCAVALTLAAGCSRKTGFDAVPPGSAVTVTERDGTMVSGRLLEVGAQEIVVDPPGEGRRVIRRDEVTSIALIDENPDAAAVGEVTVSASERAAELRVARWKDVTVPAGTTIDATLETDVGSDVSRLEGPVSARVSDAVTIDGTTVIPAGAALSGSIVSVRRPAKVKGRASVGFRFDRLRSGEETYDIGTATVNRTGRGTKKEDAMKIGLPAVGGAIVGGIIGGGRGAAIGGATGAGAGTAVVMSTRGDDVHLPAGTAVKVQLTEPLQLRVEL